ncbi:hypothetical protein Droror1_Dr00000123 [Drosera rotundifolia]
MTNSGFHEVAFTTTNDAAAFTRGEFIIEAATFNLGVISLLCYYAAFGSGRVLVNSFVAPVTDDIKDDKQLTFEEYERTWEQNEELGLNDMDTSSADAAYN